jgi:hypothetical protein
MVVFRFPASFVSALAESPHIYPYAEETGTTRLGLSVLRPFVPLSLAMDGSSTSLLNQAEALE